MDLEVESIIIHENDTIYWDDLNSTMSDNDKSEISDNSLAMKGSLEGTNLEHNFKLCLNFYKQIVPHKEILQDLSVNKTKEKEKNMEYFTENLQIEEMIEDGSNNEDENTAAKIIIERSIKDYLELIAKPKSNSNSTDYTAQMKNQFPVLNTQMTKIERIVAPKYRAEFPIKIDLNEMKVSKWPLTKNDAENYEKPSLIFERFKKRTNNCNMTRTERIAHDESADKSEKSPVPNDSQGNHNFFNPSLSEVYFKNKPIFAGKTKPKTDSVNINGKRVFYYYFIFRNEGRKFVIFWYSSQSSEFDGILISTAENTNLTEFIKDDIWFTFKDIITQEGKNEEEKERLFDNYLNQFNNLPVKTVFLYESKNNLELDHLFYQIDRAFKDFRKKIMSEPIFIMTISSNQMSPRSGLWREKLDYLMELANGKLIILDIQDKFKGLYMKIEYLTRERIEHVEKDGDFEKKNSNYDISKVVTELRRDINANNNVNMSNNELLKELVNISKNNAKMFEKIHESNEKMAEKIHESNEKMAEKIHESNEKMFEKMTEKMVESNTNNAKMFEELLKINVETLKTIKSLAEEKTIGYRNKNVDIDINLNENNLDDLLTNRQENNLLQRKNPNKFDIEKSLESIHHDSSSDNSIELNSCNPQKRNKYFQNNPEYSRKENDSNFNYEESHKFNKRKTEDKKKKSKKGSKCIVF